MVIYIIVGPNINKKILIIILGQENQKLKASNFAGKPRQMVRFFYNSVPYRTLLPSPKFVQYYDLIYRAIHDLTSTFSYNLQWVVIDSHSLYCIQ